MQLKTAICGVGLLAGVACNRTQGAAPGGMQMPPTPVELAVAKPSSVEDATEYVATLKSLHSTTVQPQIDGQITQIFVTAGQHVAAGARLIEIDPRRQQAAVSSQEAERASKEAAVSYAQQQAQRAGELFGAGAISRQELEQAQTSLKTAEADLAQLQAQVRQQEVQLRYYTVSAPTAGIVGDIPVRVGYQVSPQTLLTTIDQNETLEVNVNVPIERGTALRMGLPLRVLSSDGQQVLAETSVSFISPHVDEQTQSLLVKGTVRNPNLTLRAQQFVRARLVWRSTSAIVIPVTAVLRINGQYFIFVAESSNGNLVARQRPVRLGDIVGNDYPVVSGVQPNEQIVVSGAQKLADGAPIQPAGAAAPPKRPA